MGLTATYEPTLSRIRLAADALGATATYAVFDRGGLSLAAALAHSFEGIASGVAVTTLNSGKNGQSAFDAVAGSVVSSTDSAVIDAKGLRATLATSTESYVAWDVTGTVHYLRAYIRTPAVNSINSRLIWNGVAGSTTNGWDIRETVSIDRIAFAVRNVNQFSLGIDGVNAPLTPNTVYRVEAKVVTGAAGTAEVRLYDAAGTLLDSDTFAGAIDGATRIRYGIGNGVATSIVWDLDGIGYSTTGYLGPWQDPNTGQLPTVVRGGSAVPVVAEAAALDDYEFPAGIATTYRVRSFTAADVLVATYTAGVDQDLDAIWVKVVARPFLNTTVVVQGQGPVSRGARNGVFPVVGRSFPVAVSDVRSSRQFALSILTETADERREFDLVLASGEPIFIHTPSTVSKIDDGYFIIGDTTETPTGRISPRRVFELPLTEVAQPGPGVVGAAGTWSTVIAAYATWQAVLDSETTWADLLELVGSPSEVIVA